MQIQDCSIEPAASSATDSGANPFYLLATLYGEPQLQDEVTKFRNRRAWNRYYARLLADFEREALIQLGFPAQDVTPFSQEEENALAAAFAARQGHGFAAALPPADVTVDFQNIHFKTGVEFEGFIFSTVMFSGAQFASNANFNRAVFLKESHFGRASFAGNAMFETAVFQGPAHFQDAHFADAASWKKVSFNGTVHFDGTTFKSGSNFEEARFALWAAFRSVQFAASHFVCAQFNGGTTFETSVFAGKATFSQASFADWLSFQGANFHSSSFFHKVEMKQKTIFDEASFLKEPPEFSGAKLHQGADWDTIKWPKPKGRDKIKNVLLSYERLKQRADKLEQRAAVMEALAKKMEARPILQGRLLGLPVFLLSLLGNNAPNPV